MNQSAKLTGNSVANTGPGSVNGYVMAVCPKHGNTAHLSYLGGACCKCHDEGLVSQGLVKP